MSSQTLNLREDLKTIMAEYKKLNPRLRRLDVAILGLTGLFIVNFLIVTIAKEVDAFTILATPANMALMAFPLAMAGLLMFVRIDVTRTFKKGVKQEDKDAIMKKSLLDLQIGAGIIALLLLVAVFFPY